MQNEIAGYIVTVAVCFFYFGYIVSKWVNLDIIDVSFLTGIVLIGFIAATLRFIKHF